MNELSNLVVGVKNPLRFTEELVQVQLGVRIKGALQLRARLDLY